MSDDYFKRWSKSLLIRLHEQAGIAFKASHEVIYLREQLELVTEEDDRPLWRRIATQRVALRDEIRNRERAERANRRLSQQLAQVALFCRTELASPDGLDKWESAYDTGVNGTCQKVLEIIAGKDPVSE